MAGSGSGRGRGPRHWEGFSDAGRGRVLDWDGRGGEGALAWHAARCVPARKTHRRRPAGAWAEGGVQVQVQVHRRDESEVLSRPARRKTSKVRWDV